jgi:adenylate cyclase
MAKDSVQQCAILFVDIAGSTSLYELLGDRTAKEWITRLQDLIATAAADAGGRVHEIVGDEVMIRFDQAGDGAAGAVAIQNAVAVFGDETGARLAVRIGLHCGEAIVDKDRMFGDTVNVAARVAAIAQGGQIITTQDVVNQLPDSLRQMARPFDHAPIKGKAEPLVVYDLAWQPQDLTVIAAVEAPEPAAQTLTLIRNGVRHTLSAQRMPFALGRDPSSDLVIDWPSVSRRHATIAFSRGRFVLSDISTNGTRVTLQNGQLVFLRRESLPLWGTGHIALGAPADQGPDHGIDFCCS